jgi:hypothetical protein
MLTSVFRIALNAFTDLKAKLKAAFRPKKDKKVEDDAKSDAPAQGVKPEAPAPVGKCK